MHLRRLCSLLATHAVLVSAYYSSGWSPEGTKEADSPSPTPPLEGDAHDAQAPVVTSSSSSFDWTDLLKKGPIGGLFELAGINVTQHLDAAKQRAAQKPYDTRVPMITDENYESLVLDPVSGVNKTWFLVVSLGDVKDPVSNLFDEQYDKAFDRALSDEDLPDIMWGRVDYMAVTRVTSEWMIWKAPLLVVARDYGRELRFIYPGQLNLETEKLYAFLKQEAWNEVPVWDGPFAPGGSMEQYVKMYANFATKLYNVISVIPKWAFLVASGAIGSMIVQFMHGKGSTPAATKPKVNGAHQGEKTQEEKASGTPSGKSKRYVVKPAKEVHPELAQVDMTSSIASTTSTASRPSVATRSSSKRKTKK